MLEEGEPDHGHRLVVRVGQRLRSFAVNLFQKELDEDAVTVVGPLHCLCDKCFDLLLAELVAELRAGCAPYADARAAAAPCS
jgi:hypothetical protein